MHHPMIRIAGAGLAGLTCAINLAQEGERVEVIDSAPDSGWRRRGSWDAVENWTTKEDFTHLLEGWKLKRNFEYRPINNIEIYDPHGDCHPITTQRPLLYLVKRGPQRGSLEYSLKLQALNDGISVLYNQKRNPQDVDVWAVGAQQRGQFLGVGMQFETRHPDTVKLLISTTHAPKAYAYLFVVEGQGVISVILTRNFAEARTYLQRSLEFFLRHDRMEMENVRTLSGFGGRTADFWRGADRPLRVGEAAGFQDYLWGFGIRYALHSGYLAAQAIAKGIDYKQAVHTQIQPLVYTSLVNRLAYDRAGDSIYHLLIERFSRSPRLVELLRGRYRASIPKLLLWLLRPVHPNVAINGEER